MDFIQTISQFEDKIKDHYKYELLETHYLPYSFGSGTIVYRLRGHNLKINFDGRDGLIEIQLSPRHEKYPTDKWIIIFNGAPSVLFENGIELIKNKLADH